MGCLEIREISDLRYVIEYLFWVFFSIFSTWIMLLTTSFEPLVEMILWGSVGLFLVLTLPSIMMSGAVTKCKHPVRITELDGTIIWERPKDEVEK